MKLPEGVRKSLLKASPKPPKQPPRSFREPLPKRSRKEVERSAQKQIYDNRGPDYRILVSGQEILPRNKYMIIWHLIIVYLFLGRKEKERKNREKREKEKRRKKGVKKGGKIRRHALRDPRHAVRCRCALPWKHSMLYFG